jgi:rubrerythrin
MIELTAELGRRPKNGRYTLFGLLGPVHRWIWRDTERRAHKLLNFGETETDGGRDLIRAAETTADPLLRRLYLVHAADELRHGRLFRQRGSEILKTVASRTTSTSQVDWLAPSGHGADDLQLDGHDDRLLAFIHLSEKAAAERFSVYRDVLRDDSRTREIFEEILRDENFHMNYAFSQLTRVSPRHHRKRLWRARFSRLWKSYLRLATAVADVIGWAVLTAQYFILLPPFVFFAKRAAQRETPGWVTIASNESDSLDGQY